MSERAVAPAVGVVLLTALTVIAAAAVGSTVSVGTPDTYEPVSLETAADETGLIEVTHRGGPPIEPDALRLHVRVDGRPLDDQPPVPFFSATGFESGPTGAFNSATEHEWRAGETATLRVAGTNEPTPDAGDTLEVRVYVDGTKVADLETTVQRDSGDSASVPPPA